MIHPHQRWTDEEILEALRDGGGTPAGAWRAIGQQGTATTSFYRRCNRLVGRHAGEPPRTPNRFARLVELTRGAPIAFEELCNRLDASPAAARRIIDDARAAGVTVHIEHDHVGTAPTVPSETVTPIGVAPPVGSPYRCAVVSDTHAGSKYAMRPQLRDFIVRAYESGVREVLHCGDMLDGCYSHGVFELTHSGIDDQARDLADTLPEREGLTYHAITGNHEETFAAKTGMNVGRHIEAVWRSLGRSDITVHGDRSAYLRIGGAVVHLWHPKKAGAYAMSYLLQKQVERYSALKPQILLAGHWHISCHVAPRGVEAIAVPCFQGGGSMFAKSLGGSPSIGGLILEWRLTEQGTLRELSVKPRRYYERETIVDVRNPLIGEEVEPAAYYPIAAPAWASCSAGK